MGIIMKKKTILENRQETYRFELDKQIIGIQNHLRDLLSNHRDIKHATERARGHLEEAIRISLKMRRFYSMVPKQKEKI